MARSLRFTRNRAPKNFIRSPSKKLLLASFAEGVHFAFRVEFIVDVLDVRVHGVGGDGEARGDFLVKHPLVEKPQDGPFPHGQVDAGRFGWR